MFMNSVFFVLTSVFFASNESSKDRSVEVITADHECPADAQAPPLSEFRIRKGTMSDPRHGISNDGKRHFFKLEVDSNSV